MIYVNTLLLYVNAYLSLFSYNKETPCIAQGLSHETKLKNVKRKTELYVQPDNKCIILHFIYIDDVETLMTKQIIKTIIVTLFKPICIKLMCFIINNNNT